MNQQPKVIVESEAQISRVYVDGECVGKGDATAVESLAAVLRSSPRLANELRASVQMAEHTTKAIDAMFGRLPW